MSTPPPPRDPGTYLVIYDGLCNLCSGLVQVLQRLDRGQQFTYLPMQDEAVQQQWQVTPAGCELGMILIDRRDPERRWQGSAAAEEITRLLPGGTGLIDLYRLLPGLKSLGDRCYIQVRDHRYDWFGRRPEVFRPDP
ncbi:MAG: DUF393 domain-containing protein [Synechococcales cyanobacterium]